MHENKEYLFKNIVFVFSNMMIGSVADGSIKVVKVNLCRIIKHCIVHNMRFIQKKKAWKNMFQ